MRLLLILLLLPAIATAKPRMVFPANVLSVITADWNKDGQKDRAVLINNWFEGTADLYIYIGDGDGFFEHSAALNIVSSGSMWGQQPSLEITEGGDLQVLSTNHGMGRTRWFQTLTIVYMEDAFVMAEFSYSDYDSIDTDDFGECDINLLTGRGQASRGEETPHAITLPAGEMPTSEWNIDTFPEECF